MKKEKYYYSKPAKRGCVDVVLDSQNNILEIGKQFWCIQPIPRITICGIYDNEQNTMSYGVAKCNKYDEFNKKLGQEISYARAMMKPYKVVEIHPEDKISELFIKHARIIEEEVLEHWSKK